jgi:hypothetical protein
MLGLLQRIARGLDLYVWWHDQIVCRRAHHDVCVDQILRIFIRIRLAASGCRGDVPDGQCAGGSSNRSSQITLGLQRCWRDADGRQGCRSIE